MAVRAERRALVLGTRASKLALAQSEIVRAALLGMFPDLDIRLEPITTRGDTVQDRPLSEIGGNGVFVRQIEAALIAGRIDLAVHSAKDLPSAIPPDTALAAFLLLAPLYFLGPFAVLTAVLAIRDMRRNPKLHGMGRAIFGLVMGSLGTVGLIAVAIRLASGK